MLRLFISRLIATVPLLAIISFLIFSLIVLIPGNPAVSLAGHNPSPEQIALIRQTLGLDDPFLVRYWHWLSGVLHGDLGHSLFSSQPVWTDIAARLPTTVSLVGLCMAIALLLGVPIGAIAGLKPGSWVDRGAAVLASAGLAMPYFWVGMLLIMLLSMSYPLFPAVGYVPLTQNPWEWFRHLLLPALALSLTPAAIIARQTRASLVTVISEDYIRTARAKGLSSQRIVVKHALKNAALPVVTVFGIEMSRLLGGTVVIEQLFSLPGIGKLAYDAVFTRDFPVVQGVVLVAAVMVIVINILVDVSYAYFNPRVR